MGEFLGVSLYRIQRWRIIVCAFQICSLTTLTTNVWLVGIQQVEWQKKLYKKGKIRQDRCERLNAIGFTWDVWEAQWNLRYSQLMLFKKEFGHCRVPQKYEKNPSLGERSC